MGLKTKNMIKKNTKLIGKLESALKLIQKEIDLLEENEGYESDEYGFQFYYALSDVESSIENLLDNIKNDFYL